MKAFILVLVVIVVAGIGFWWWKSKSAATTSPDHTMLKSSANITAQNLGFSPTTVTVKAGAPVSFKNMDGPNHTVTSGTAGQFDTGVVGSNQTGTFTAPNKPGSYPFHCTIHPNMKGTLVVQ